MFEIVLGHHAPSSDREPRGTTITVRSPGRARPAELDQLGAI